MRGQVQVVAAEDDVRVAVHVELHKGRILAEAAVHQQRRRGAPCLTHRAFRLSRGGRLGQRGGLSGTAAALPARVLRAQCACGARALIGRAYEARARRRSNDPVEFGGLYRECERLCLETLARRTHTTRAYVCVLRRLGSGDSECERLCLEILARRAAPLALLSPL